MNPIKRPLTSSEIAAGYSVPSLGDLALALRNCRTLNWWAAQSRETKVGLAAKYAKHLGCPSDEVFLDVEFMGNDEVEFIHGLHAKEIGT